MPLLRWFMSQLHSYVFYLICGDLLLSATHRFVDRKHNNNCLIGAPLKWTWLHHILFVNQHALLCLLVKHNRVNNRKFWKVCVLEHSSTKNTIQFFILRSIVRVWRIFPSTSCCYTGVGGQFIHVIVFSACEFHWNHW